MDEMEAVEGERRGGEGVEEDIGSEGFREEGGEEEEEEEGDGVGDGMGVGGRDRPSDSLAGGQPQRDTGSGTVEPPPARAFTQAPLQAFMPPHLPNLAQAALQRLASSRERGEEEEEEEERGDSREDFKPRKKRKLVEVQTESEDDQEGQCCSICFEPWSNSGGHRIASLKCGHLFGLGCIEKWLRGKNGGKCPQCNAKAKRTDIRVIFAKSISVVDTTDRDAALKELETEKGRRLGAEKSEAQAILQHTLARAECDRLKDKIKTLKQRLQYYSEGPSGSTATVASAFSVQLQEPFPPTPTQGRKGCYNLKKTITVSQQGGSRVLAFDPKTGMLVASRPSNSQLMPGHGLLKLSLLEPRYNEYMTVHAGIVRDVAFRPCGDGLVLTAGMDKCCKMTSMHSNAVVQSFQTGVPAWACAWDLDDSNLLYCGLQNGTVEVYDVRNTAGHVQRLLRPGGGACPVTSLAFAPLCRASTLNCSGVLMGTLDGSVFWEKGTGSFTPHQLHTLPEGACTSVSFEPLTRHCLASFRPSKRSPHTRHILCQLLNVPVDQPFSCRPIHQFTGGTAHRMLSRSQLCTVPGSEDRLLAAFGDEGSNSVHLWDVSSTAKLQQLSLGADAALDLSPCRGGGRDCLAVLTATKLLLYEWQWV